mmetsp:Transcript_2763/g.5263  ORF Transcript_2763/g.5263 Transcript_2763/m.5263 type:complete len:97 (+) Transcript_2763:295-585(+)
MFFKNINKEMTTLAQFFSNVDVKGDLTAPVITTIQSNATNLQNQTNANGQSTLDNKNTADSDKVQLQGRRCSDSKPAICSYLSRRQKTQQHSPKGR